MRNPGVKALWKCREAEGSKDGSVTSSAPHEPTSLATSIQGKEIGARIRQRAGF